MNPETNIQKSDLEDSYTFTPAFHYLIRYFTRAAENAHYDKYVGKPDAIAQGEGEEYTTGLRDALISAFNMESCSGELLVDVVKVLMHAGVYLMDRIPEDQAGGFSLLK